jgi:hypothetical protein
MAIKTLSEGVDYELVPSLEGENEQSWDVRILKGDFVESVIRFGILPLTAKMVALISILY